MKNKREAGVAWKGTSEARILTRTGFRGLFVTRPGLLTLALLTLGARRLAAVGLSWALEGAHQHPGLHPLGASSSPPPAVVTKKSPGIVESLLGTKSSRAKNTDRCRRMAASMEGQ